MKKTFFALLAAGLVAGGEARAQLTCTPNRLRAGEEIRIGSPGAFGGAPSAEVTLSYSNATGSINRHFGSPRAWSTREVAFLLPSNLPDGVYGVTLSSPAGALRNPTCFTIGPPLVGVTTIRGPAGVALATLDTVVDGDWPCTGETMIRLWGKRFTPGTEAAGVPSLAWTAGKTMVEFAGDARPFPLLRDPGIAPRMSIRDAGTIEYTTSRCILLLPGLKARIWFPDGTKSAWQYVMTEWNHGGSSPEVIAR
jgi:hypothetical protein